MIRQEEVFKIGTLGKPHGVKGEINFTFTNDAFDREEVTYLVFLLEGILVPFFIEEYRFRSDDVAIIKFEGIDTAEQARHFTQTEVYLPISFIEEEDYNITWSFFKGFKITDIRHGELGIITEIDTQTINILFVITDENGRELLLPANEAFIRQIDRKKKHMVVDIPDGLLA